MIGQLHTIYSWWRLMGLAGAFRLSVARLTKGLYGPKRWSGRCRGIGYPLTLRLRGSDRLCFNQIFVAEEYACLRDLEGIFVVLDLGANIGLSSVYFLNRFPARIVAVEPDERNVEICRLNLQGYGARASILHGAVWSKCGQLNLSPGTFRDGMEWSTQVTTGTGGDVGAWDMPSLISMAGGAIDLLKVDIERAELEVFKDANSWLPRIRNICIELHGDDCREVFFTALADYDYQLTHSGELTICRNLQLKSPPHNSSSSAPVKRPALLKT